jgi:hypothetical protein
MSSQPCTETRSLSLAIILSVFEINSIGIAIHKPIAIAYGHVTRHRTLSELTFSLFSVAPNALPSRGDLHFGCAADVHDAPQHRAIVFGVVAVLPRRRLAKTSRDDDGFRRGRAAHRLREPQAVRGLRAIQNI